MKVIAFIEPPQGEVIERILRHCGLWRERESSPRGAARGLSAFSPRKATDVAAEVRELTFVDMDTFWATF